VVEAWPEHVARATRPRGVHAGGDTDISYATPLATSHRPAVSASAPGLLLAVVQAAKIADECIAKVPTCIGEQDVALDQICLVHLPHRVVIGIEVGIG